MYQSSEATDLNQENKVMAFRNTSDLSNPVVKTYVSLLNPIIFVSDSFPSDPRLNNLAGYTLSKPAPYLPKAIISVEGSHGETWARPTGPGDPPDTPGQTPPPKTFLGALNESDQISQIATENSSLGEYLLERFEGSWTSSPSSQVPIQDLLSNIFGSTVTSALLPPSPFNLSELTSHFNNDLIYWASPHRPNELTGPPGSGDATASIAAVGRDVARDTSLDTEEAKIIIKRMMMYGGNMEVITVDEAIRQSARNLPLSNKAEVPIPVFAYYNYKDDDLILFGPQSSQNNNYLDHWGYFSFRKEWIEKGPSGATPGGSGSYWEFLAPMLASSFDDKLNQVNVEMIPLFFVMVRDGMMGTSPDGFANTDPTGFLNYLSSRLINLIVITSVINDTNVTDQEYDTGIAYWDSPTLNPYEVMPMPVQQDFSIFYSHYVGNDGGDGGNDPVLATNCFTGNAKINTDQGIIELKNLNKNFTINNKEIKGISKTTWPMTKIVVVEKGSLGSDLPNERTMVAPTHRYMFNGKLQPIMNFVNNENIYLTKYKNEPLYNVILGENETMIVNGAEVESLDPNSLVAKLFDNSMDDVQKKKLIKSLNKYHKNLKSKKSLKDYRV
jgi:hypothetical protein